MPTYTRPKTLGELKTRLQAGEHCEIVTDSVEFANIGLRDRLNFDAFTVTPSENPGWSVRTPRQ